VRHTFQEWIVQKWQKIDQDNLHMKFSALNVDFNSPSPDSRLSSGPMHESVKVGYPSKSRYFAGIGSSSMKTVADKHNAAYHNKHWWRAFSGINVDDLQQLWTPQKGFWWFLQFFRATASRVNSDEMDGGRPRWPANRNCHRLSRVSQALAQISCTYSYRVIFRLSAK